MSPILIIRLTFNKYLNKALQLLQLQYFSTFSKSESTEHGNGGQRMEDPYLSQMLMYGQHGMASLQLMLSLQICNLKT